MSSHIFLRFLLLYTEEYGNIIESMFGHVLLEDENENQL